MQNLAVGPDSKKITLGTNTYLEDPGSEGIANSILICHSHFGGAPGAAPLWNSIQTPYLWCLTWMTYTPWIQWQPCLYLCPWV